MSENIKWTKSLSNSFDSLTDCYAVYVITLHSQNGDIAIYSGQTKELQTRTKKHWSENEENEMLRNVIANYPDCVSIYWTPIDGHHADGYERYLYDTYKPQTQSRAPEHEPIAFKLEPNIKIGRFSEDCFKKRK